MTLEGMLVECFAIIKIIFDVLLIYTSYINQKTTNALKRP